MVAGIKGKRNQHIFSIRVNNPWPNFSKHHSSLCPPKDLLNLQYTECDGTFPWCTCSFPNRGGCSISFAISSLPCAFSAVSVSFFLWVTCASGSVEGFYASIVFTLASTLEIFCKPRPFQRVEERNECNGNISSPETENQKNICTLYISFRSKD